MIVKLQEQFARLEEMGNDEYRGFYIELPRPTPEEWGDCEASIADGEYESKEEYLQDWELLNPRETVWYHVSSARYRENRTIQFTDRKHSYFTIANYSRYINRVGNNFPNEWQRDFLAKSTSSDASEPSFVFISQKAASGRPEVSFTCKMSVRRTDRVL